MVKLIKQKSTRKFVDNTSGILMLVGAINWGLIGLAGLTGLNLFNLETLITSPMLLDVVYSLVGASGVYALIRNADFMK